jgi:prolyl 4-hydroxylase
LISVDGQQYGAHWDWFDDPVHHSAYLQDGNRYATVLLYLSEVEEGGETALPLATAIDEQAQVLENPSACAAKQGIAVRPKKGDALLFFDLDIMGSKGDRAALHASCPTLKGTKWTATKW